MELYTDDQMNQNKPSSEAVFSLKSIYFTVLILYILSWETNMNDFLTDMNM